jgi:hypothetical protein
MNETPALSPRQHPRPMRYNSPQPQKAAYGSPEALQAQRPKRRPWRRRLGRGLGVRLECQNETERAMDGRTGDQTRYAG